VLRRIFRSSVGLIDGTFRANLEETGMGYSLEVDLVRTARALDLLTTPYVFSAADARAMAEAGADVVVAHMGLTTKGAIGASTAKSLDDCVALTQAIADAAHEVDKECLVLVHGGPVAEPEDAEYVLKRTSGVVGFYGASSLERLPVEIALRETAEKFKGISFGKP
jgi:predicted TIM-barrel enzyme